MSLKTASTALKETGQWVTPEERAKVTELQDELIERFVECRDAVAEGREARAEELQAEIDGLLREKGDIEKWAAVGSA